MKRQIIVFLLAFGSHLLASCDPKTSIENWQKEAELADAKQMTPAERNHQKTVVAGANRCLALLEAAAAADKPLLAELVQKGVPQVTAREIGPIFAKTLETERASGLTEKEIGAIVEAEREKVRQPEQLTAAWRELTQCVELSRLEALKSSNETVEEDRPTQHVEANLP